MTFSGLMLKSRHNTGQAELAQLVEHATENRSVHSSILWLGILKLERPLGRFFIAENSIPGYMPPHLSGSPPQRLGKILACVRIVGKGRKCLRIGAALPLLSSNSRLTDVDLLWMHFVRQTTSLFFEKEFATLAADRFSRLILPSLPFMHGIIEQ